MTADRDLAEAILTAHAILRARPSIYDQPPQADSPLYFSPEQLQALLRNELVGVDHLASLPIRTRSKVAKTLVAGALGYSAPTSFARTQPRLPHVNADVYVQQSNNLQIWNAEVDAARRYIVIGLDHNEIVQSVRVIAGADLANFDTTGTLTRKYQASRRIDDGSALVNAYDTAHFVDVLEPVGDLRALRYMSPVSRPERSVVATIGAAFDALTTLVGSTYSDPGLTQERLRGEVIHRAACGALGLASYADNGQFPDILSQAIEVKLQLARTVDLGLELPSSDTPVASLDGRLDVRDVRYAIFYGERLDDVSFAITSLVMTSGAHFFDEYQQFGGKVSNSKIQLRLPDDFFV